MSYAISTKRKKRAPKATKRFEAVALDTLFPVLDAICWLNLPTVKEIAQFAGIDPRTARKHLKNCSLIGVIQSAPGNSYTLAMPFPFKGSITQKESTLREALLKTPLVANLRQFLGLGDTMKDALRKAAVVDGVPDYREQDFSALLKWMKRLNVLENGASVENLVVQAIRHKKNRHSLKDDKPVVFLSHCSLDKPFIRRLATDLEKNGIAVWLDEQRILVGDSISEKIGHGLAESDFFVIALSESSVASEWVKKELSKALLDEVEKKEVRVHPVRLSECLIPPLLQEKKYADFVSSYEEGLHDLLRTLKERITK